LAGDDARTATPPDPRLPRRGLTGCRQLDPSHRRFLDLFARSGSPASLGPGLTTASGAKMSFGGMLPWSAVCAMTGESTAKNDCIRECEQGWQLINLGRKSERTVRTESY
jgi:hypothetical protein